jgi:UrcA family protein
MGHFKIGLLLLGSIAGAMAANAGTEDPDLDVPSVVVKYADLSLESDAGVRELYRRITFAAQRVCPTPSIGELRLMRQAAECRDQAVARAIRQVDNSRLAALYAHHSKNG